MALDVNGFAVFRSIGSHPHTFAAIAAERSWSSKYGTKTQDLRLCARFERLLVPKRLV